MSDLVAYLLVQVSDRGRAPAVVAGAERFGKLPLAEQVRRLPATYLALEQYLVELDPCKKFLREQLREIVKTKFSALIENIPYMQEIFHDPSQQEIFLCRRFLTSVIKGAMPMLWGNARDRIRLIQLWLDRLPADSETLPFATSGEMLPSPGRRGYSDRVGLAARETARILENRLGERVMRRLFESAYEDMADHYIMLETFPAVITLLPERSLDREKMGLLTYGRIRRSLFERTEQLHEINEQLLTKNKELGEVRDELHKAKDMLEVRVRERTAELREANEQLRGEIQERMRAEAALQASRQYARNIVDSSLDMIIAVDPQRRIVEFNKAAQLTFGHTFEEVEGQDVAMLYANPEMSRTMNQNTIDEEGLVREVRNRRKSGEEFPSLISASLLKDPEGKVIGYMGISRDITKEKQLEQQLLESQKMESIGLLAGGIAHDINNVLTPILMGVDIVRSAVNDDQTLRMLEMMEVSAKRGADVVKQILTIARRVEGERTEIQPRTLIKEMSRMAAETFPKSIKVQTSIPKDLWMIMGDTAQLHQILLNLVINARDAMPKGGTLSVAAENIMLDEQYARLHMDAKPGPHLVLQVFDTGMGIPPDIRKKIFEPFFTTKEPGKGTGLGLSTVHAIVKSHRGFINVYSEVGKGTRFRVYLPAVEGAHKEERRPEPRVQVAGHGELILVVDDEESVLEITRLTLEGGGYKVLSARDGVEAMARFAQHRTAVRGVITDMSMPLMDGPATIRALRRLNPHVKVIAASGFAENKKELDAEGIPVEGFLEKPFTAERLLSLVHDVVADHGDRRTVRGKGVRPSNGARGRDRASEPPPSTKSTAGQAQRASQS